MKKTTSYIIYGFKKSDFSLNDYTQFSDYIPWDYFHYVNNEIIIGPAVSKVEGFDYEDKVDVKFDTLAYLRRMFQESIVKASGVYIPDSVFKIIHMTIEESIDG